MSDDVAKGALDVGHTVVAPSANVDTVTAAVGECGDLVAEPGDPGLTPDPRFALE